MRNNKKTAAGIVVAVVALVIAVVLIFTMNNQATNPANMLSLGERYLLDMQFEQALVQFLAVIEIEPMNVQAYLGAAEAFVGLGQMENAANVLRQGLERTGSEEIRQRLVELDGTTEAPCQDTENDYELEADTDDEQERSFEEEDVDTDAAGNVNLTGMPPLSFQEIADWGFPWGVSLRDIVYRYGLDQSHADDIAYWMEYLQIDNHDSGINPGWGIAPPEGFYSIGVNRDLTINSVVMHDMADSAFEYAFARQMLRFKIGMSILDVIESIAISNPAFIAAAIDPNFENLASLGAEEQEFRAVLFDSVTANDGTIQELELRFYREWFGYLIIHLHNAGRTIQIVLFFDSDGRLNQSSVYPNGAAW